VAANPGPNGYNVLAIDGITHSLGTTWSLPEGNHQISVAGYVYCGYYAWGFDYFTCNGNTYYSNSINLPIYADTTVIAHYTLYY
jgi:hypothetical protein